MGGPTFTHLLKRQRRRCSLQPVLQIHLLLFHEPLEQCGPHPAMRNPHRWHRRFAARYAHRCRGGRPRSRARPHIPSRIAPSGFHTCGPRTAAARTAYARQAHPRLRRDTAMPRRRIPRAGHFNIMLARISPSSSSTIISPCGHGALRYSDRRVYTQFPMGIASMLLLVSQQVLVGRGDRRDIRRCCLSYHAISSFSNPGEP